MKKLGLAFLFFPALLFGQFRFGGWFRNDAIYTGGANNFDNQFTDLGQLKFNLDYRDAQWRILGDLRLDVFYGYNAAVKQNPNAFLYQRQNNNNNFALGIEVPRLYFRGSTDKAGSFTLGRSYLNFGQNQLFNALEWHKNFSLTDPSATKPGVNMLSWDMGMGAYSRIKAFIGGDDTWAYPLAGIEIVTGLPRFEIGFAYQYKGEDRSVLGLSFKADLVLTFFGTYAAHLNKVLHGSQFTHFHDLSLGFDYSFPLNTSSLVITQIFYYNSAGASSLEELFSSPGGDYYFRSQGYSHTTLMFNINEFISIGAGVMVSLMDGSGAVLPTGKFTLANNLVLDAVLGIFFGKKNSEFAPSRLIPNASAMLRLTASF